MIRRLALLGACLASVVAHVPQPPKPAKPKVPRSPDLLSADALERLALGPRPTTTTAPPVTTIPATALPRRREQREAARQERNLARIRACESGGDYSARSASGKHGGAYQFDRATFASVGGTGDPATASPAEQDRAAARLYSERGAQPWPNCA